MNYFNHPERKPNRLRKYDYSTSGSYFITICTLNRDCVLSSINSGKVTLTEIGKIAEQQILSIPGRYSAVAIDEYVIMPNHIHMILVINKEKDDINTAGGASPSPTVPDVIRTIKSQTTRSSDCNGKLFQRSFHDHIIRNKKDHDMIKWYIQNNPARWQEDCFHPENNNSPSEKR